ncbi:hypothetical protein WL51_30535 [Burkholderia ubonensis]|uniref:Tn3 transposase DDE domain-containing protein n=1 Tax=Burkholderia ubonensis TaxID=101571 RepID=A0ABD4E306_9BURK|nr:hypothetical protein WJ68_11765 [Burkholderia ubonensis]KVO30887.1 hypothetical protein WJ74_22390 [Burkholderia ubonensis]KVZ58183.1 hypothetical protein WL19_02865 [Burkholderia ubonensis]KVZ90020.1 hypothetical protein WL24_04125 [Burkholderia ubonensis]KWB99522.1 hypothetical protein WL44_31400 [Burkholderia ubonensis]
MPHLGRIWKIPLIDQIDRMLAHGLMLLACVQAQRPTSNRLRFKLINQNAGQRNKLLDILIRGVGETFEAVVEWAVISVQQLQLRTIDQCALYTRQFLRRFLANDWAKQRSLW